MVIFFLGFHYFNPIPHTPCLGLLASIMPFSREAVIAKAQHFASATGGTALFDEKCVLCALPHHSAQFEFWLTFFNGHRKNTNLKKAPAVRPLRLPPKAVHSRKPLPMLPHQRTQSLRFLKF